ncbi:GNAT family N-acetyltransferase [Acetivibrio cellulolyticus]|uniref:GNAT family N-acetyltransferase n=1 Tax=Acetivibrio cellulolyticus TaxID=35830 RepID=UPI0001E2D1B4|nr:GNAT family N-acetyltransferase [Acetivibrio cellulolyticus]
MSRIFDNTIITTVSYWSDFIKDIDVKLRFSKILEQKLRCAIHNKDQVERLLEILKTQDNITPDAVYKVLIGQKHMTSNTYLLDSINESGANINDFPQGYVGTISYFNKVESYFHSDKPTVLYAENVEDIDSDYFLARLLFRKANNNKFGDLLELKGIFEENSISNGGYLGCTESAPNEANIDNVYVISDGLHGRPLAYASLEFGVHQDMVESRMIINKSFKEPLIIYIKQCAVNKQFQGRGVGMVLYKRLFSEFQKHDFYAHVSVRNIPSQKLHYRSGFQKIGVYECDDFHGMKNYMSDFLYKKCSQE